MNQLNQAGAIQLVEAKRAEYEKEKSEIPKPNYFDELQNRLNAFHKRKLVGKLEACNEILEILEG